MRFATLMVAAMLATSGLATLDAVPAAAQGSPGGPSGGQPGGFGGPQAPGGLKGGANPAMMMFQMLDTDKDDIVTEQEFFAPHEQRFDAIDSNKDGRLTPQEFTSMTGLPPGVVPPQQGRR